MGAADPRSPCDRRPDHGRASSARGWVGRAGCSEARDRGMGIAGFAGRDEPATGSRRVAGLGRRAVGGSGVGDTATRRFSRACRAGRRAFLGCVPAACGPGRRAHVGRARAGCSRAGVRRCSIVGRTASPGSGRSSRARGACPGLGSAHRRAGSRRRGADPDRAFVEPARSAGLGCAGPRAGAARRRAGRVRLGGAGRGRTRSCITADRGAVMGRARRPRCRAAGRAGVGRPERRAFVGYPEVRGACGAGGAVLDRTGAGARA